MKKHEWRETTDQGETRFVRVTRTSNEWKLQSKLKSDEEWTYDSAISLEDLETLREVIANKQQRRRLPYEHLLEVEALIAAAKRRK